jgi:hypothetical protein
MGSALGRPLVLLLSGSAVGLLLGVYEGYTAACLRMASVRWANLLLQQENAKLRAPLTAACRPSRDAFNCCRDEMLNIQD